MKYVALQYSGLVRGFRYETVRNNIYDRLIKPLNDEGYEVHIFWHTYDTEYDDIIHNLNNIHFNVKDIKIDSDKDIHDFLQNKFKLLEKYNFPKTWETAANVDTGTDTIVEKTYHQYGWFKYLYSVQEAVKLRNKYEKKNNIKYDWVISTSPQCEPQNIIDNLKTLDNNYMYSPGYSMWGGYYASFYIGNSEHINYLGEYYNYMVSCDIKEDKNIIYNNRNYIDSEPLLKAYIDKKYSMKPILGIRFHRIRFNGLIIDH